MSALKRLMNALRIREQRDSQEWIARNAALPLYMNGGTTWICTRCNDLAFADPDGRLGGCSCPIELGPSPLVPTNPDYGFVHSVETQMQEPSAIEGAARHLLDTMNLIGADGKALFKISDEYDDASAGLLRHAVINLHAALYGSVLPDLALPQETH